MQENAHDKFAKSVFSDRSIFIDLVQQLCPPGIAGKIDYDTVQLVDNGHVEENLDENFSDLVYECRLLNERPAFLAFVMENKTDVPKFPHLQLSRYQQARWEKALVGNVKKLPLVICILLYHGKKKWPNKPFSASFEKYPAEFEVFLPRLNYILLDLSNIPDLELIGLRPTPLINALAIMKHCYEPEYLKNNPDIIFINGRGINATDKGKIFLRILIEYFSKRTQFSPREKQDFIEHKIDPIMRTKFKSTWDMLIEEGREEGREEGELKLLTRTIRGLIGKTPDISDHEISVITGAALKNIRKIRQEIEEEIG